MTDMAAPILVVDDEPLVLRSMARALERGGADVVTAADGREALEKFRTLGRAVVFTDVRMPGMDGFALLRSLKSEAPDTQVVLVTGFASDDVREAALAAGATDVLAKPFTHDEITRLLASLVGRETLERAARDAILTAHPQMERVLALARRVAQTDATVLIEGETGTGKELLARFVHRHSSRANGPFVPINCAALPEALIESELFGHEKGAFTGAFGRRIGRFEAASGGTLLLDEIGELPLGLQAKLLRALQEGEITRIGATHGIEVDVRVIAITNRDLRAEVAAGRFRQDLFYRLNVVTLRPPALRDRGADIPVLARHFLLKYAAMHASPARAFSQAATARLLAHGWPGNVRELENAVQRAVIVCTGTEVAADDIALDEEPAAGPLVVGARTISETQRDLILSTLERMGGNRTHAARALGISARTVRNHLRKYRSAAAGAEDVQDAQA
jgi:two-component system response regulator FlrC